MNKANKVKDFGPRIVVYMWEPKSNGDPKMRNLYQGPTELCPEWLRELEVYGNTWYGNSGYDLAVRFKDVVVAGGVLCR